MTLTRTTPARGQATPLEAAIRSADRTWGPQLVDVAIAAANARAQDDPERAVQLLGPIRARRRENMDRLADSLLAIARGAKAHPGCAHWVAR